MCETLWPLKPQKGSIMLLQHISYYGVTSWPQITYINTNVAYLLHGKCIIKYKTIMMHNTTCTKILRVCVCVCIYIYIIFLVSRLRLYRTYKHTHTLTCTCLKWTIACTQSGKPGHLWISKQLKYYTCYCNMSYDKGFTFLCYRNYSLHMTVWLHC